MAGTTQSQEKTPCLTSRPSQPTTPTPTPTPDPNPTLSLPLPSTQTQLIPLPLTQTRLLTPTPTPTSPLTLTTLSAMRPLLIAHGASGVRSRASRLGVCTVRTLRLAHRAGIDALRAARAQAASISPASSLAAALSPLFLPLFPPPPPAPAPPRPLSFPLPTPSTAYELSPTLSSVRRLGARRYTLLATTCVGMTELGLGCITSSRGAFATLLPNWIGESKAT